MKLNIVAIITITVLGSLSMDVYAKNKWVIAAEPGKNGTIETLINVRTTYQITIVSENEKESCAKFWLIETGSTTDLFNNNKVCKNATIKVGKNGFWSWIKSVGKTEVRYGGVTRPTLLFVSAEDSSPSLSIGFSTDWENSFYPYSVTIAKKELKFHYFELVYEAAKKCNTSFVCWEKAAKNSKNQKPIDYDEPITAP